MKGKTVLITGGTSGIGLATSKALAAKGANLVLLARNLKKAESVITQLSKENGNGALSCIEMDLANLKSVEKAIAEIKGKHPVVDVLINNAGGMFQERLESADGYELTFAMNHLGHFVLTNGILENIKASEQGRIINVSSAAHKAAKWDFDDLMGEKNWSSLASYGNAKLANIFFTKELARRLSDTPVTVNALHPGVVNTGFGGNFKGLWKVLLGLMRPFMLTPEKGAATSIYLASSPDVANVSGSYFVKRKEAESSSISHSEEHQKRLWEVSEELANQVLK